MADRLSSALLRYGADYGSCRRFAGALLSALAKIETLTGVWSQAECAPGSMRVCFEAGYDGFWLARLLMDCGFQTTILDPSSFLVSRRGQPVVTDRVDVEAKAYLL